MSRRQACRAAARTRAKALMRTARAARPGRRAGPQTRRHGVTLPRKRAGGAAGPAPALRPGPGPRARLQRPAPVAVLEGGDGQAVGDHDQPLAVRALVRGVHAGLRRAFPVLRRGLGVAVQRGPALALAQPLQQQPVCAAPRAASGRAAAARTCCVWAPPRPSLDAAVDSRRGARLQGGSTQSACRAGSAHRAGRSAGRGEPARPGARVRVSVTGITARAVLPAAGRQDQAQDRSRCRRGLGTRPARHIAPCPRAPPSMPARRGAGRAAGRTHARAGDARDAQRLRGLPVDGRGGQVLRLLPEHASLRHGPPAAQPLSMRAAPACPDGASLPPGGRS